MAVITIVINLADWSKVAVNFILYNLVINKCIYYEQTRFKDDVSIYSTYFSNFLSDDSVPKDGLLLFIKIFNLTINFLRRRFILPIFRDNILFEVIPFVIYIDLIYLLLYIQ